MRLGASNLAWEPGEEAAAFAAMGRHGFEWLEVAPTLVAPWDELDAAALRGFRDRAEAAGLRIGSLQAILFNRPDCTLLGDADGFARLCEHMRRVGGVADALGAGSAVFGSPGNRRRGELTEDAAQALAVERFDAVGRALDGTGLALVIEPVPESYNCDFMTRIDQVNAVVSACGRANIRSHVDTACVSLGGDAVGPAVLRTAPLLRHFHVAEPQLGPFDPPTLDHSGAAAALRRIGYAGGVVLEMRRIDDGLAGFETALRFIARTYASPESPPPCS